MHMYDARTHAYGCVRMREDGASTHITHARLDPSAELLYWEMMHASDKELNGALDRATRLDTARERLDTARISRADSLRGDAAAPAALAHEDSLRRALVHIDIYM